MSELIKTRKTNKASDMGETSEVNWKDQNNLIGKWCDRNKWIGMNEAPEIIEISEMIIIV